MSLSNAKRERMAQQRRVKQVQGVYPRYPFGVLDSNIEEALRRYIDHADATHTHMPWQLRDAGAGS